MLGGLAALRQLARQPAWQHAVHRAAFSVQAASHAPKLAQAGGRLALAPLAGGSLGSLRQTLAQQQGRSAAMGLRHYSFQQNLQEASQKARAVLQAPVKAVRSVRAAVAQASGAVYSKMPRQVKQWIDAAQTPGRLNRVISLQLEAFWQQHGRTVMIGGALAAAYLMWRALYIVTSVFVDLSDKSAMFGFLGLASSTLVGCYLFMKRRYSLDPNTVYRLAMLRLNTDPGVLEVMGAPLAGSPLRASVMTGGGLRFHGLRPSVQSRRLQMIFPLKGSERRGLVSLEAKKRRGRYSFKLLSVDVPSAVGGEQRIFLAGDEEIYSRGGVMGQLRDPFTRAMSLQDVYELEDAEDDKEDREEAKEKRKLGLAQWRERAPKPLDEGGGMFIWERAWFALRRGVERTRDAVKRLGEGQPAAAAAEQAKP